MVNHPLEPLIIDYLAEKDVTKGTRELYTTVLNQYTGYLKEHHILYAKKSDVINYINWKKSQGYSTRWVYHQISAIKGLYKYLSLNQKRLDLPIEYASDITATLKNVCITQTLSKPILTAEQAKHLILHMNENRKYIWHYRDYAIIYLMLTTGMRTVEIRRAKKKDLKIMNHQPILYIQGKGRQSSDEYVKLSKGAEEAINDYLKRRNDKNPYLFISHSFHTDRHDLSRTFFLRMIQRVLKDCGLEKIKITPHSLRHTAATFNLLRGSSLESTKKFMRHSNIASTLIYAHHISRLKDDSENQIEKYVLKEGMFLYEAFIIQNPAEETSREYLIIGGNQP